MLSKMDGETAKVKVKIFPVKKSFKKEKKKKEEKENQNQGMSRTVALSHRTDFHLSKSNGVAILRMNHAFVSWLIHEKNLSNKKGD